MGWTVRRPRFELREYTDGWGWELINDGKTVAGSYADAGKLSKEDAKDFIRWLKYHAQEVPIIGDGTLEL